MRPSFALFLCRNDAPHGLTDHSGVLRDMDAGRFQRRDLVFRAAAAAQAQGAGMAHAAPDRGMATLQGVPVPGAASTPAKALDQDTGRLIKPRQGPSV